MDTLKQDLKYSFRKLVKSPGFTAAAVLTLALGIGANTAIFSVVNGVLLSALPYRDSDRLVRFGSIYSFKEFEGYRDQNQSFAAVGEYHNMEFPLAGGPEPDMVRVAIVNAGFFQSLGIEPILGRTLRAEEDSLEAPTTVVLTERYWHERLGGDPNVVGRSFELNGQAATVVGVVPNLLPYPKEHDIYANPIGCSFRTLMGRTQNSKFRQLYMLGRLKPGVTLEQAKAEVETIGGRLKQQFPEAYTVEADMPPPPEAPLIPLQQDITGTARPKLLILLGTVGLVLLIACFNVGNLTLARLAHRDREVVMRSALGASRKRVIRQLLTESTMVALLGGALGLAFALLGLNLLTAYVGRFTVRTGGIGIDGPVLLFTLGVSLLAGLLFGAVPVLASSRRDLAGALKEGGGQATTGARRRRFRSGLLVLQVAVSFVLLVSAGLSVRNLAKLYRFEPGFNVQSVLTMNVRLPESRYQKRVDVQAAFDSIIAQLESNPRVESAAVGINFPLFDDMGGGMPIDIEGRTVEAGNEPKAAFDLVTEHYFETLDLPLLQGRNFTIDDTLGSPRVTIINRSFAERDWPGASPVGQRITPKYFGGGGAATVVGVVADARNIQKIGEANETRAAFYLPFRQQPARPMKLFVKTAAKPETMEREIIAAIHAVDSGLPVSAVQTVEKARRQILAPSRVIALLLGLFGAVAFAITAVGMSGVTASSVAERTQELGIRSALGAGRRRVLRLVLRRSMALALGGLLLGLAGALLVTRVLSSVLYDVAPTDPLTFLAVALVLLAVAWFAAFLPARRATRIDPVQALRYE